MNETIIKFTDIDIDGCKTNRIMILTTDFGLFVPRFAGK